MAGITTSMTLSFKTELLQASHCFQASTTATGTTSSGSTSVTTVSSVAGIMVGMGVTGTGMATSATVAAIPTTTSLIVAPAATAAGSGTTFTFSGDIFKLALIKSGMTGTYGVATTNYSQVTGNSDEVSGTGYSAGGVVLGNVNPTNDAVSVAYTSFSPNPSWTGATFSTAGCMIYNSSLRNAGATGRAVSVHDFGGNQSVSAGTLTILIPSPSGSTALLRLS